jgi:hypothetical protein
MCVYQTRWPGLEALLEPTYEMPTLEHKFGVRANAPLTSN